MPMILLPTCNFYGPFFLEQWLYNSSTAWYEMHWTSKIWTGARHYFTRREKIPMRNIKEKENQNINKYTVPMLKYLGLFSTSVF